MKLTYLVHEVNLLFSPYYFVFLVTRTSVYLAFYVLLSCYIYENLRNEKAHSIYICSAVLFFMQKVSLIVPLPIILQKMVCLRIPS